MRAGRLAAGALALVLAVGLFVVLWSSGDDAESPSSAPAGAVEAAEQSDEPSPPLGAPTGPVILTISGDIGNTNVADEAQFDREMLLSLGTSTLRTTTSWTDGVREFEGVLGSDIMRAVGAQGTVAESTALNDYTVDIPLTDFDTYDVVFALTMDGVELTPSDRGPIWPVYPRDDHVELQDREADKKWIYQLSEMHITDDDAP